MAGRHQLPGMGAPGIPQLLAEGVRLHQSGRRPEAERLYNRVLALNPNHADALHLLGMLAHQAGRFEAAVDLIGRAIRINGAAPHYHSNLGMALWMLDRPDEAVASLQRALALNPDYPLALSNLSNPLRALGRLDEAEAACRKALALNPDFSEAHLNLGHVFQARGALEEAVASYGRALAGAPGNADLHTELGGLLVRLGRYGEADAAYRRALAVDPGHVVALNNLGLLLRETGRLAEAESLLRRAIARDAGYVPAHNNLGNLLRDLGRAEDAEVCFRRALDLDPGLVEAHNNLGNALKEQGRLGEAESCYRRVLDLNPDLPEGYNNLGSVLIAMGRSTEAAGLYRTALDKIAPEAAVSEQRALFEAHIARAILFCAMYQDELDTARLAALHREFGAKYSGRGKVAAAARPRDAGRIRIGYLSSDLHDHPVAYNMVPVIRHHDRTAFEIHLYALNPRRDRYSDLLKSHADHWHEVVGLSDEAIARRIAADGIDILVCLAGRADRNRPTVCGWRAAPVQISFHDLATSGLAEMDYIIADRWMLPRNGPEYFSERRLRLPRFYVAEAPDDLPPPPEARRSGAPVFCCFNNPSKIGPAALALWGRILARLPDSRLILKYRGYYAAAELRERFRTAMAVAGAAPDQVSFLFDPDSRRQFLARYNDVDIALDTFPFSGSTTSFQALSMGVPVVTLALPRMVSRWSAAMLTSLGLGLEKLVADTADGYVDAAIAAAGAVEAWRGRRPEIRERTRSLFCDAGRWTRHLERLYRAVWRRACR